MSDHKSEVEQMWRDWFTTDAFRVERQIFRVFRLLPHDPRCKICYSPFRGTGGLIMRSLLGRKQSNLNPHFCNVCEDFAKRNPGGAEVEMSMLFADVRGSTALSEQMTSTEFNKLINRFYIGTTNAIAEEDGLVEKLAGDAVAAFWGAGFAGKDYVAKTIRAAQTIAPLMQKQNIPVGIGVHAGVAYFGAMGSADGLINISAIGEEVNAAARLASKAAAGEIILSEPALAQAHLDGSELESRKLELKGISEQVSVRVMRV
ncbi:MAG TPA: adenylate/guanylate cyclase domain-containing protein [Anaerolineales bacterium]|nr:adenylate/guanylate cyclase domain-containing protein [Anaerolineales bacterium]